MTHIQLRLPTGESALVSRYGGQLLSWVTADGAERLYCSPLAVAPGRPIRGGVPVCFPQFASRGPLAKHGFARTCTWELVAAEEAHAHLRLRDDQGTQSQWPHGFALDLNVNLAAGAVAIQLQVSNTGAEPWSFMAALHTYLRVADVAKVRLDGLQGLIYEDALRGGAVHTEGSTVPDLAVPIDRVYRAAAAPLRLHDGARVLQIQQDGFEDVVVWNPGTASAAQLGDMPADDAPRMLCVEAARIARPLTLKPGQSWTGSQRLLAAAS